MPNIVDIDVKMEREETLGIRRINQFNRNTILEIYTCTECGRCSDHCPATKTGKKLSPKHFTLDLRDFLYKNEKDLVSAKANGHGGAALGHATQNGASTVAGAVAWEMKPKCVFKMSCWLLAAQRTIDLSSIWFWPVAS